MILSDSRDAGQRQRGYVQVFRSGAVEAVTSGIGSEESSINIVDLAGMIVRHLYEYSNALRSCGIQPPLTVMASLIGVNKLMMTTGNGRHRRN